MIELTYKPAIKPQYVDSIPKSAKGNVGEYINKKDVGQIYKVLIEGNSKKSDQEYKGRNSQNKGA